MRKLSVVLRRFRGKVKCYVRGDLVPLGIPLTIESLYVIVTLLPSLLHFAVPRFTLITTLLPKFLTSIEKRSPYAIDPPPRFACRGVAHNRLPSAIVGASN